MKRLLLTFALIFAFVCAQAADITSISNAFKAGNVILYNFAGVWAMALMLLPRLLGRRGKAMVNVIDGWIAPKKA